MNNTIIGVQEVVNQGIMRGAPVNARFDATLLSPHLINAEEFWLIETIGQDFYDDLILQKTTDVANYNIANGPIVIKFGTNVDYEEFWTKYLYRYISNTVLYEALPFLTIKTASNGLYLNNSEFSENAGVGGMKTLQDALRRRIEKLKIRMLDWLCDNRDIYTLFDACDCKCRECGSDKCKCKLDDTYSTFIFL